MQLPNCPVCNTNIFIERVHDCSSHAQGSPNQSIFYSDSFVCSNCGGHIHYMEETIDNEIMWMDLRYRKDGYTPNVKVVG